MMEKSVLQYLKDWLEKEGNSADKLAAKLGYSGGSVIRMWISRGSIPQYQQKRLLNIILGGGKKNVETRWGKKGQNS